MCVRVCEVAVDFCKAKKKERKKSKTKIWKNKKEKRKIIYKETKMREVH